MPSRVTVYLQILRVLTECDGLACDFMSRLRAQQARGADRGELRREEVGTLDLLGSQLEQMSSNYSKCCSDA